MAAAAIAMQVGGGVISAIATAEEAKAQERAARREEESINENIGELIARQQINERALKRKGSAISAAISAGAAGAGIVTTTGSPLAQQAELAKEMHIELSNMRRQAELRISQLQAGRRDLVAQTKDFRTATNIGMVAGLFGSSFKAAKSSGAFDKNSGDEQGIGGDDEGEDE